MAKMDEDYLKRIMTTLIVVALLVLVFFILKPILMSVVLGIILGFIFTPVYGFVLKYLKSENLSVIIICIFLIALIILPFWVLTPIAIEESFKIYQAVQRADFIEPLKSLFPSFFSSEQFSSEISDIVSSFVGKTANSLLNFLSNIILNFVNILLQLFVVLFTFYFFLRDKEKIMVYIKSLLPFDKAVQNKLFYNSKAITTAVLYGQIVVGIIQGLIAGLGFFIFGVPSAVVLTIVAVFMGIFPIVGTLLVWLPVAIYLFLGGNTFAGIGVFIFGILSSSVDNLLRPLIVSMKTKIHSGVILLGMVGGFLLFGILGFILGPLILSYLLVLLELYRNKKDSAIFIQKETK